MASSDEVREDMAAAFRAAIAGCPSTSSARTWRPNAGRACPDCADRSSSYPEELHRAARERDPAPHGGTRALRCDEVDRLGVHLLQVCTRAVVAQLDELRRTREVT